ncbi:surface-adhesin E family protein [Nitrosomonas sp.]|uniref:surface-adhesin E family protein n=1 Tax=Nitrosomonas sp. TaxID=42353 RepID=UPI001DD6184A|nr:surface-adhesin E family protein [Nitrosomonas sp.]MBX3616692.1 hypothetical protein [Nitrosomonas sp.]
MKKIILALTFALISTETLAQWTLIGESPDKGGYTAYVDLASIRKAGNRVKMWILFDYKTEQRTLGANYFSEKIRREFDCEEEQMRKLAFSFFSWNMEKGDLVRSYSQPQKWEKIQDNSMDEKEWQLACSKNQTIIQ